MSRKQEIIKVAAKLFKQKGYSAVTMRDLASAIDIKAASLYNHITSKQDILQQIILNIAEEFTKGMSKILEEKETSTLQLEALIKLHTKIAVENPNGLAALNTDWMHLQEKLKYYTQLRNDYETNFRQIIEKGIQNNEIKNVNTDVVLFSMLSTLRSLYLWIPKKENLDQDQLTKNLTTILIKGITNNSPKNSTL